MAESVDATVSNTVGAIHPGSSPGPGTTKRSSPAAPFFLYPANPPKSLILHIPLIILLIPPILPILPISPISMMALITLISLKKFALQVLKKVKSEKFCGRIC